MRLVCAFACLSDWDMNRVAYGGAFYLVLGKIVLGILVRGIRHGWGKYLFLQYYLEMIMNIFEVLFVKQITIVIQLWYFNSFGCFNSC